MSSAMLTAKEVAARLGVSARMVYDLLRTGRLPGYKIGRSVRFEAADIEAFKARCRLHVEPHTAAQVRAARTLRLADSDADLAAYFRRAGIEPKLQAPS